MIKSLIKWIIGILFWVIIGYCIYLCSMYIDSSNIIRTRSAVDFNLYEVRDKDTFSNIDAANRLAIIHKDINRLVKYMKMNNLPDEESANRLFSRWSGCKLKETLENDNTVAFTMNKGSSIHMCVRSSDDQLEDYNIGMFVVLHELAHIMTISYGHTEEFNTNFAKIIDISKKLGIYRPIDFSKEPKTYCGTTISTIPTEII